MPNIPTYDAKTPGIDTRPLGRAADAYSSLARTRAYTGEYIGNRIAEAGAVVQDFFDEREEQKATQEISQGSAASAAMNARLSSSLNDLVNKTDANLVPGAIDGWNQNTLEPELQRFQDSFETDKGKEYARRVTDSIRQHYFERGTADTATAKGAAVRQNATAMKNNLSAATLNDPTSLNMNLALVDTSMDALIEGNARWLSPAQMAALNEERRVIKAEITKAAGIGMADINPDAAAEDYRRKPQFAEYLGGEEISALERYARVQQNNRRQDAEAAEVARKKAEKEAVNKELVKLEIDSLTEDGRLQVPSGYAERLTKIAMMPGADVGDIRAMKNGMDSIVKDEISGTTRASDPTMYEHLRTKLNNGTLTKPEVYQARADGLLSNTDTSMFSQAAEALSVEDPAGRQNEKLFNEFLEGNKKYITNSNPMQDTNDPNGDRRFMEFSQDTRVRYRAGLAAGKTPEQLLMPRSPDYIARDIGRYQTKFDDSLKLRTDAIGAGRMDPVAPVPEPGVGKPVVVEDRTRRAGESMEDFKKRIGF